MKKNKPFRELFSSTLKKTLKIMRNALILLFIGVLQAHAIDTYSQKTRISVNFTATELTKVLDKIEEESEFYFLYNEKLIDINRKVDVTENDQLISIILDKLFKGTDVKYVIVDRKIILAPEYLSKIVEPQQKQITGKVTDEKGNPLSGVTVLVKGTTLGTLTDASGKYVINDAPANATLVLSFIGMTSQEIAPNGKMLIDVVMKEAEIGLDEVVVIGYGTTKKVNLTGSVGAVSGEKMEVGMATNALSLLQGRVSGVTITNTPGTPGKEDVNILIRGLGTMNNASPLILVDGLESRMDNITPGDIESVSVLKDAAAAAIYGSRAANGVVLITTRRGTADKPKINYRNSFGWQQATRLPKTLSSADFAMIYNEGLKNEGKPVQYSDADIAKYKAGNDPDFPNTNWLNLLLTEPGFSQDHTLSFTGGNEVSKYRISGEYFNQGGLMLHSDHKRYNLRVNVDTKVKEWFNLGLNAAISRNNITEPNAPFNDGTEFFRSAFITPATIPNKTADGQWYPYLGANPIAWLHNGGLKTTANSHFLGSTTGELKILKGLTLKGTAGVNYELNDYKSHANVVQYSVGSQGPNYVSDELTRQLTITLQSVLNYETKIGDHGVKALLGASREMYTYNFDSQYRNNLPSDLLDQIDAGSTAGQQTSGTMSETKRQSYFGRVNYVFKGKYLLEGNLRADQSSKFAAGKRTGYFPSVSAGWRVSEEDFMKNIPVIKTLKIRGSWGKLGNDRIGDYGFYQLINLTNQNYNFGGSIASGAATTNGSNPNLTWETTTELDLGMDLDLFKNNFLSFSVDYYNRYTNDILTPIVPDITYGIYAPTVNLGAMRNKGVELQLDHNYKLGDFQYSIGVNMAINDNKVEKYPNPTLGNTIRKEGEAWDAYYGYEAIGIYQTDAEAAASPHFSGVDVKAGDLIYKDLNGDGKLDANDRKVLGNSIPKITYSSNITLKYKGFDLSAFFQGTAKVNRVLGAEGCFWPFENGQKAVLEMHLDRTIVEDGQVVTQGHYPRTLVSQYGNRVQSSFSVLNASYLRLKNLELGYNLPASWLNEVKIAQARIYVGGQNLFTSTKMPDSFDPEISATYWSFSYPQVKFYNVGIDVTF
jgi:TonB-linked SusC/RagA family outer membrane protein